MCGITGIYDFSAKREIDRYLLERMTSSLFHRGPNEGGFYLEAGLGLGHRRLSIIDISSGQQPLFNEDGSVVVVFNGEIYNFQDLMLELTNLGHKFRTRSDTEVIVHAWEEWGEACVNRFRGMFAFAVWDYKKEILFLARDRLGVKPLYYAFLPHGTFIFGSELKALLAHPSFDRSIEPLAVEEYFAYGYVPEPRTIFKQALKLPPASTLSIRRGGMISPPQEYWDIPFRVHQDVNEEEAREELVFRLQEAIRIRLVSEVPLGAFLSGGIDSSAVVAIMAGLSREPVNACSISFGDPAYNESAYANRVAQQYGAQHRVEQVEWDDFSLVDRLAQIYDEPYADSSAIPTYRVCELAKKSVTVALSGDGGDESFAGYRRYKFHLYEERFRSLLPLPIRKPIFELLGHLYPKADWAPRPLRAKTTFQALSRSSVQAYFHSVSLMDDGTRRKLFSTQFRAELSDYSAVQVLQRYANRAPTDDPLSIVQYLDMKTYLVGDILTKVDRASMAHALEVREPLLDHPLVEWLSCLPPTLKLRGGESKYLFKKALERYLPPEILYRPKQGFAVPLASWFRGPLKQKVKQKILGSSLMETGMFNGNFLRQLVDQHETGRRDFSAALWSLLMFQSFLVHLTGSKSEDEVEAAI